MSHQKYPFLSAVLLVWLAVGRLVLAVMLRDCSPSRCSYRQRNLDLGEFGTEYELAIDKT